MNRLHSKRVARLAIIFALAICYSSSAVAAEVAPHHSAGALLAQTDSAFLPGFAEPSSDVTVISTAIGNLEVSEPATFVIERLRIAPGDEVPAIDGAQILQVEHGTLSYTDDLGLEAELLPDSAGFFAAGNATPIVNEQGVPAIVVRTTITGATSETEESSPGGGDEESTEPDDQGDGNGDSTETGERPTPTEESGSTGGDALAVARSTSLEARAFTSATPEASPAEASPVPATPSPTATATATPTIEPTSTATPVPSTAKLGVLLEGELTGLPSEDQQMFAADVELQPGAQLVLSESTGPIGLIARGGDLTVEREGMASSKLRNFSSVILPTGISATLVNEGDAPLTLQIGGISGVASGSSEADETATTGETPNTDDEPVDVSGAGRFIPTDSEMENLGLYDKPGEPIESTNASLDLLWFADGDEAEEELNRYNWRSFLSSAYDSDSKETEYGEVEFLVINVDVFASSGDSTDFYNFVRDDIFRGSAGHSQNIGNLPGVDAEMRNSFFNSDDDLEYGFMVIRSGEYTITIFVNGPDLNAIGMMEALANLIFGARG